MTMKPSLIITCCALLVLPFLADFAWSSGWYHNGYSGGWVGMLMGPVMMIVWLALGLAVVLGVLRLFGIGGRRSVEASSVAPEAGGETALDILKRRFASGEIDAKTFDSMKARLAKE